MARVVLAIALAVHIAGGACAIWGELRRRAGSSRTGALILVAAWILELAAIAWRGAAAGALPLRNGAEYLLVLGWAVLGLHLVLWYRARIRAAVLLLPPLAALLVALALIVPTGAAGGADLSHRALFVFHTAVSTAGMAALAVSFAMGVLFLAKERALKSKSSLAVLERLPSLETIDRVGSQALLWGFPLLTLGIATGMIVSSAVHGTVWSWGLKEVFPLLSWTAFAAIIWARFAHGSGGRRAAVLAIAGFALGLLTILGMPRG